MNDYLKQVLDFPSMVNQKIMQGKLNIGLSNFNSKDGIRCYVKYFYQLAALVFFILMEYTVITNAIDYFSDSSAGMLAKIGSVLSFVLFAYAAFPMAQVIRTHGDSFHTEHKSMVEFVFKDFVLTNIRIMGEIIALSALFGALNTVFAFVFDADLLTANGTSLMDMLNPIYTIPISALSGILESLDLYFLSSFINSFYDLSLNSQLGTNNGYSFFELVIIAYSFFNVIIGLAIMYVNIAIYRFLYTVVEKIVKFIPNFHIPIGIKNK
jgi:hypothetical protein